MWSAIALHLQFVPKCRVCNGSQWIKRIWKWRLQYGGQFVFTSICQGLEEMNTKTEVLKPTWYPNMGASGQVAHNNFNKHQNTFDWKTKWYMCPQCRNHLPKYWSSWLNARDFVPRGPIDHIPSLIQIMAWRQPGDNPLPEPMMVSLLTHILSQHELNRKCQDYVYIKWNYLKYNVENKALLRHENERMSYGWILRNAPSGLGDLYISV